MTFNLSALVKMTVFLGLAVPLSIVAHAGEHDKGHHYGKHKQSQNGDSEISCGVNGEYSVSDIEGDYRFSYVQARWQWVGNPSVRIKDYCSYSGTATFDGLGNGTYSANYRCSETGVGTISATLIYEVETNGEVLFHEVPPTDPNHGWLVNNCQMITFDSTTRLDPDHIFSQGIVSRQ